MNIRHNWTVSIGYLPVLSWYFSKLMQFLLTKNFFLKLKTRFFSSVICKCFLSVDLMSASLCHMNEILTNDFVCVCVLLIRLWEKSTRPMKTSNWLDDAFYRKQFNSIQLVTIVRCGYFSSADGHCHWFIWISRKMEKNFD